MRITPMVLKAPEGFEEAEHISDYEGEEWTPEANTSTGLIPNSYIGEDGRRHAVIWQASIPEYMRLNKVGDTWQLIDLGVF